MEIIINYTNSYLISNTRLFKLEYYIIYMIKNFFDFKIAKKHKINNMEITILN